MIITSEYQKMNSLFDTINKISDSDASVLLIGESGTGKSLFASYIHDNSRRKINPFIIIDCGSLSETLWEDELFGHVKGAFTGAITDKKGKFEAANGGTIFLDNINCISPVIQMKLFNVFQNNVIERLGENVAIPVDFRIISGTEISIREETISNKFRDDLFYRISTISLNIPPLRERPNDIEFFVEFFIKKYNKKYDKTIKFINKDVLIIFKEYRWPGNISELESIIESLVLLNHNNIITSEFIPHQIIVKSGKTYNKTLEESLAEAEKNILLEALENHNWNRNLTASSLGISRTTLFNKMRRFHLFSDSSS